jgi:hypothetical protein
MAHDFASEEDLLDRLTAQPHDLVFLVGSAVTAPGRTGEPGVPRVDGVIDQIRRVYHKPDALERFEKALAEQPSQRYQAAFRHLQRTRGQDLANAIIRRCVLQARVPSQTFPQVHAEIAESAAELCRNLEHDVDGWHLPPAVKALGRLLAGTPAAARPIVLTSNFDPLITVSVHRAGGRAFTTALHSDGGFAAIDGQGTLVVHFHGDWFRSDTLHTPAQLGQDRPRHASSLAQLLGSRTLVVLGYGGWDDIFTRSLVQVIRGELAAIDVLWAFYGDDEAALQSQNAGLLASLGPGIERARVMLYKGIDAHTFLPRLADAIGSTVLAPMPVAPPTPVKVPVSTPVSTPPTTPPTTPLIMGHTAAPVASSQELGSAGDSILGAVVVTDSGTRPQTSGLWDSTQSGGPKNPFQKSGALAPGAPTYIMRSADAGLAAALSEHPLIVLRGEFSIGKSSLLLRSDRYWLRGSEAAVCRLDLMEMRIDDVNLFYDEFFAAIGKCYGENFQGWQAISTAIERRPLLLLVDEFSGLTPEVAARFVPALHRLGTRHGEQLRVVVTARDAFETVLASFQLNNPNLGDWNTVEILPLRDEELAKLLGLLPPRSRAAAMGQIDVVRRMTAMGPKPAQCLCFNLFKDELAGVGDAELAARCGRKDSYR